MIFAQATAESVGLTLLSLAVIGGILFGLMKLLRREPAIEAEFATKNELKEVRDTIKDDQIRMQNHIEAKLERLDDKRSEQVSALHGKLNSIAKRQERIDTNTEHLSRQVSEIRNAILNNPHGHAGAG